MAKKLCKRHQFELFHHVTYANDWMASHIGALLPIPYIRGPGGGAQRIPRRFRKEYSLKARLLENARSMGQWIYRHDPFFILSQHRASAILVCCRESMDKIPDRWKHKAQLFPVNGISSSDLTLAAQKREKDSSRFRILSAGKLIQLKGFPLAIRAFKTFSDKYPESEFIIVGEGPERPRLEALIEKLGLQERVSLPGWMGHDELLGEMASCDVFLFASMRDGGGQVIIEAMAARKPVVCLDLGGPGIHVTEGCGIKVPADTPERAVKDMAAALEKLYLDEELRLRMGEAARKRVEEHYHWDKLGERLMKIYERAVSEAKSNEINNRA